MKKTIVIMAIISAMLLLLFSSLFIVRSDQFGMVSRFGKVTRTIDAGGLYFKWPYPVDHVFFIDKKKKVFQPSPLEVFLPDDQNIVKNVTLAYYIIWRISDPLQYFETLRDENLAQIRIENNLRSIVNNTVGNHSFLAFISINAADLKTEQISLKITGESHKNILPKFGITIEKVDINRIILPEQNKEKVFERMVAERSTISNRYRAEGEEQAKMIISEANREKSLLMSQAEMEAQTLISEAEAEAASIYADAFNKNPEFYKFWRQLKSFEESFDEDTTFILSSDDPLLIDGAF